MLENGAVNNAANIRAGFAACGIYPLDKDRVLSRLPPEETRRSVQTEFDQLLLAELQRTGMGILPRRPGPGRPTAYHQAQHTLWLPLEMPVKMTLEKVRYSKKNS
jgi:hypothetical protein